MRAVPTDLWIFLAGLVAGSVNAAAGGGTLLAFPVLIGVAHLSPLVANTTCTVGLLPGIIASTVVSLWAWRYERKRDRSATMALFTLGFVLIQAAVGIISNSATIYLAQPVLMNAAFGIAFLVSVPLGKPLAGLFANEFYPFPPEVRSSRTFRKVFGNISLVWGFYNIVRSGLRLVILAATSVELFLAVNFITGVPLMMAAMTWSIWRGNSRTTASKRWSTPTSGATA